MTLHLAPELEERLENLAIVSKRTPDELAGEAVSNYLSYVENLAAEVREGEDSAERDGWLTHEEVFKRLDERLRKTA